MMSGHEWAWYSVANEPVKVLGRSELWGRAMVEIVVPSTRQRLRVLADDLTDIASRRWSSEELSWRAAATVALALAADGDLLVPARGGVSLLPHQLVTVERTLAMDTVRLAVCDDVGLGKTITAGAIFAEMKARRLVNRVVVVAPKGVQLQWIAEMKNRFGEEFVRIGPEGLPVDSGVDPWSSFDRVVCSLDAVKPLRRRAGWSPEQVMGHNARRFRGLIDAGWDMVIIDEAHHVAGSSDNVARHQLAVELAAKARHLLLLSATPHSGKTDGFRRFLGLLDDAFVNGRPIERRTVAPIIARTEKRAAIDCAGNLLFRPRVTDIRIAPYVDRDVERELYEAVTEYVRHGWNAAECGGRNATAFVVLLMQRLASSSTAAIRAALENRSAALGESGEQLTFFVDRGEEWAELTGEEQYEILTAARGPAWATERSELSELLRRARVAAAAGADAKVRAFFHLLTELRHCERDPKVKVLVFTEFVATQEMLLGLLEDAGLNAVAINGSMGLAERAFAQEMFRSKAQILVSTDAGGEGINLQFAHVVVNWDLPWSPTRLEQRIGRVDRIGQTHTVRAYNLVCEHSVEQRVLEVLDQKLAVILDELGADRRGDVLQSASRRTEELWATAIVTPERLNAKAETFATDTLAEASQAGELAELVGATSLPTRTIRPDRLTAFVRAAATARAVCRASTVDPLDALADLPEVAQGEPCPVVRVAGMASGWLSVWGVTPDGTKRSAMAVYKPDEGFFRPDDAILLWERCAERLRINDHRTPTTDEWETITADGVDHAYQAAARIAGPLGVTLPDACLRVLVRVEP